MTGPWALEGLWLFILPRKQPAVFCRINCAFHANLHLAIWIFFNCAEPLFCGYDASSHWKDTKACFWTLVRSAGPATIRP